MQRVSYEIEFLTPAFIGGSDPATAELTANGIRGHLRWWFRCVAGGRFAGDLPRISASEARLFGATEHRSALRVVVAKQPQRSMDSLSMPGLLAEDIIDRSGASPSAQSRLQILKEGREVRTQPLAYLGFGPVSFLGATSRQYLAPGKASFFIQYGQLDAADMEILGDALWAWMNLGAIGSRSRRGFGSFTCLGVKLSGKSPEADLEKGMIAPSDPESFDQECRAWLQRNVTAGVALPEWSHLSSGAAVFRAAQGLNDWRTAMKTAAAWLIAFRRRYGMGAGTDYDWFKARIATGIPHRAGFGLPLPFGKGDFVANWHGTRRASPLLIRIARFGGHYYPIFTYLPARFLPHGEQIRFHGATAAPGAAHAAIVPQFLAELASRGKAVKVV